MLDKLVSKRHAPRDSFTDAYGPEQAVVNRKLVNGEGHNLHVLFPPWHGGSRVYECLITRLAAKDDAVLAYYFHDEILRPHIDHVTESFAHIRDTAVKDLKTVTDNLNFGRVNLVGMSLGNSALASVTDRFEAFDSVNLVMTGSSLARSMWHGIRTQHVRRGIENMGHNLSHVEEAWSDLTPINHLEALLGKEVNIVLSSTDAIIPAAYQQEFLEGALDLGINPNVQVTRLGHYATIGRFCLQGTA